MNVTLLEKNQFNNPSLFSVVFLNPSRTDYEILFDIENTEPIVWNQGITSCALYLDLEQAENFNFICFKGFSNTNVGSLRLRYNYVTGGAFTMMSLKNCDTSTAYWSTNFPSGNFCFELESLTNYVAIQLLLYFAVYTSTNGIAFNYFAVGKKANILNPKFNEYVPMKKSFSVNHENSGGGNVRYKINDVYTSSIKLDYVSSATVNELRELYDYDNKILFIPNATYTSWDGNTYNVNWINSFDFYNYTDNYKKNGFLGSIDLSE